MYRGSPSPIFDVPEFPSLRRVKPLPKRRRTTGGLSYEQHGLPLSPAAASALAAQGASALLQQGAAAALHQQQQLQPLDPLSPNVTAEELLAHADTLSARMALQNYYMPILGGMQSFLNGTGGDDASGNGGNSNAGAAAAAAAALAAVAGAGRNGQMPIPLPDLDSIDFGVHFAAAAAAAAAAGVAMGGLNSLGMGLPGMNAGTGVGGPGVAEHHTSTAGGNRGGSGRHEEEGRGDGDYIDHLQQPGNTKKRKVPTNAGGSPRGLGGDGGRTSRPSSPFLEDDVGGGGFSGPEGDAYRDRDRDGDRGRDYDGLPASQAYPPPSFPGQISMVVAKKGKLSAAALAGLQHKELLKSRKRQLAAVLGALSHGDTLALDQALSASYPLVGGLGSPGSGGAGDAPRVRKSRRKVIRLSRVMALTCVPRHPDAVPLASSDFSFACPSATADRLIATKEEVTILRNRFEAELERQAAKAAKMAVAAASGKSLSKSGGRGKRERVERDRERAEKAQRRAEKQQKAKTATGGTETREDSTGQSDPLTVASAMGNGAKTKNGKKKKRSALANASNPHHLRNYVPSRLPHTGGPGGGEGGAAAAGAGANPNTIWPLPLRFLSAEIPPRRRKKAPVVPLVQLTHPADEWICAFCEYDLFYGEEPQYRRGVRNRKKILRRRRRARERAAAAASGAPGTSTAKVPPPPPPSEEYDGYEPSMTGDEYGSAAPQRGTKWKGDPNKDQPAAFG